MRIQLVLQVFQFRFRLLSLRFYQPLFRLTPTQAGTNGRTQSGNKNHHPHIPRIKYPTGAEYDVQTQGGGGVLILSRNT